MKWVKTFEFYDKENHEIEPETYMVYKSKVEKSHTYQQPDWLVFFGGYHSGDEGIWWDLALTIYDNIILSDSYQFLYESEYELWGGFEDFYKKYTEYLISSMDQLNRMIGTANDYMLNQDYKKSIIDFKQMIMDSEELREIIEISDFNI